MIYLTPLSYTWGNQGPRKGTDLPKGIPQITGKASTGTLESSFPVSMLLLLHLPQLITFLDLLSRDCSELKAGGGRICFPRLSPIIWQEASLTRACSSTLTYSLSSTFSWRWASLGQVPPPTHEQSRSGYKVKSKVIGPRDSLRARWLVRSQAGQEKGHTRTCVLVKWKGVRQSVVQEVQLREGEAKIDKRPSMGGQESTLKILSQVCPPKSSARSLGHRAIQLQQKWSLVLLSSDTKRVWWETPGPVLDN